ncbi:MAG: regulator of sigma E protease [Candidatus Paceibacteria bacterium]|jgi:regulator of sigma E protease
MSVIIFIIILGVLIFVHELGHFLVAKKSGIRVDEFAIGFPPKIFSFVKGGTKYALNLIPFGGYVKIFGENPNEESLDANAKDSFVNKSKWTQASVLVAGVLFNTLFAWLLISVSLMSGFPSVVTDTNTGTVIDKSVVVTSVLEDSPAEEIGLQSGDKIISLSSGERILEGEFRTFDVQSFVKGSGSDEINLNIVRSGDDISLTAVTEEGVIEGRRAIGISMEMIGTVKLSFFQAFKEGFLMTGQMISDIAVGLVTFLGQVVTFQANFANVAGPVGIVGLVDDASNFGLFYLFGFTAFISLNLAVLNLLPFPALDGGRLLFVAIEGIIGRPIKPSIANTINALGFGVLILLMIVITVSDVMKLF